MRIRPVTLLLALAPHVTAAQATTVEEPLGRLVEEFTRLMGVHRAIGNLETLALSDSALESRFWSTGWTMSGLRLQLGPFGTRH